MRRQSLIRAAFLLAPLLAGCKADPSSVVVLNARAPGSKCDFSDDTLYVSGGSLDLRPYILTAGGPTLQAGTFYQVFSWQNNLVPVPLVVNGQTIDSGAGNNFIANQVFYSYQWSGAGQSFASEISNTHAVIFAGGTSKDNSIGIELLQPKAAAQLATIATTTSQTLLVTFKVGGNLAGGNGLDTNEVAFPLTIYKSSDTPLDCSATGSVSSRCGDIGRDAPLACN